MRTIEFLIFTLILCVINAQDIAQRDVLLKLFSDTKGDSWRFQDWLEKGDDYCTWVNIECDNSKNVVKIDFENMWMDGTLPTEISQLQALTHLRIQKNDDMVGTIPPEYYRMTNLKLLNLADNSLTGTIPAELEHAAGLRHHQLTYNRLTGTIPHIRKLKYIEYFCVGGNRLTGTIPVATNLDKLKRFSLFQNQLTGPFPSTPLPNLNHLYIDDNRITGTIPYQIGDLMPKLHDLYISKNQLTGPIPASVGKMSELNVFYTFNNKLSGSIPSDFAKITSLLYINISVNELTGRIPIGMKDMTKLVEFDMSKNQLTGDLPSVWSSLEKIRTFDISRNKITGTIPPQWKTWYDLEYFRASHNEITGTIPETFTEIPYIIDIRLNNNKICGQIPNWLIDNKPIRKVTLDTNQWQCPVANYCDDEKDLCDWSESMECTTIMLVDPERCLFQTSTPTMQPTTTSQPSLQPNKKPTGRALKGCVFTEHKIYDNSKCESGTKVLHDIQGEVGCATETWENEACQYWYSFHSATHHCECVTWGNKCKKTSELGTTIYKITDPDVPTCPKAGNPDLPPGTAPATGHHFLSKVASKEQPLALSSRRHHRTTYSGCAIFTEEKLFDNSRCITAVEGTVLLEEVEFEFQCADAAWVDEECGYLYMFNSESNRCECLTWGTECQRQMESSGTSVVKLVDPQDDRCVQKAGYSREEKQDAHAGLGQYLQTEKTTHEQTNSLYLLFLVILLGLAMGFVIAVGIARGSKNRSFDEQLID